jgi:tRNA-specific 2-thiouridylase
VHGNIVDASGAVVGKHKGIAFYTIGQRRGIGSFSVPYYVLSIDSKTNTITVGEEPGLYRDCLTASGVNWLAIEEPFEPLQVRARIRYKSPDSTAMVYPLDGGRVKVAFEIPQRAIAPGQAVVFYDGDTLLGGAWIE